MFSKGVVLIFLILGLSSSLAHAIPHQNRAQNSCNVRLFPSEDDFVSHITFRQPLINPPLSWYLLLPMPPKIPLPIKVPIKIHQGKPPSEERETRPQSPATTRRVQILRAMAKMIPQSPATTRRVQIFRAMAKMIPQPTTKAIRAQILRAMAKTIPQSTMAITTMAPVTTTIIPSVSIISPASRKCSTHLLQGLDSSVLSKGSESDGLNNATAGTAASLTSNNNFIDFCKGQTITSGQQIKNGSCNPIPMGVIAAADKIPSCKYVSPQNLDTLKANTPFTMKVNVKNAQLGVFTNADENYYSAPQQVNKQGLIIGHTHLVVEEVGTLKSTTPTDPNNFAFFKGIDDAADVDGNVSANVTAGLPQGVYRMSTIGTTANHAPFLVGIAQHGIMEDAIYVGRSLLLNTKINF